jgi:magnesium chelatase family protein
MLVAASNPCPCGNGPDSGECECNPGAVSRYRAKLSGALADRIDITLNVERPSAKEMAEEEPEGSDAVRERVTRARWAQEGRLGCGRCNADMTPGEVRRHCVLDAESQALLDDGHRKMDLSGRGWDRCLKLARTVADLDGANRIECAHVAEALNRRRRPES